MGKRDVHATLHRSWLTGRITAPCGASEPAGGYKTTLFGGGVTCPGCKRALKEEKMRKRGKKKK